MSGLSNLYFSPLTTSYSTNASSDHTHFLVLTAYVTANMLSLLGSVIGLKVSPRSALSNWCVEEKHSQAAGECHSIGDYQSASFLVRHGGYLLEDKGPCY